MTVTTPTSATGIRSAPEPRRTRARGFTLLELIIAIALIGLAVTMVTLSMGGIGDPRPAEDARALADRIALVLEESAFTGRVLGLRLRDDPAREGDERLEFVELMLVEGEREPRWQLADPRDRLLAPVALGERLTVMLEVEAQPADGRDDDPEVLLLPDGELTPFELTLGPRTGAAPSATLTGDAAGALTLGPIEP